MCTAFDNLKKEEFATVLETLKLNSIPFHSIRLLLGRITEKQRYQLIRPFPLDEKLPKII